MGLWLFFSHIAAMQQLNGVRKPHLQNIVEHGGEEDGKKQDQGGQHRHGGNRKNNVQIHAQKLLQQQEHGPGEQDPQPQSQSKGNKGGEKRFPKNNFGDMEFLHA